MTYRVWFEGREFGKDYPNPRAAWAAALAFGTYWGDRRYVVRDSLGRFA